MEYEFDLFTIGAGSGGVAASRRAGSYGAKVAICESSRVGGTCVLRGCVPKKLLWYASHFSAELADSAGYGWTTGEAKLDWGKLVAAKNAELDRLNGIYLGMLDRSGVKVIEGRGRIVDPHTIEVAGQRYTTRRILVATGGCPHVPDDIPGAELGLTSNEALDLTELPRRIAIVGAGYIAVEFAGIFAGAGSHVTLMARGYNVLRHFDPDVSAALTEALREQVELRTHTQIESVVRDGEALSVRCRGGYDHQVDALLWATGRWPNTRGIGLEDVGVELDDHGAIKVDEWSCTSVPGIYAIGDCTQRVQLTPVAIADGRALVQTLFNDNPTKVDHEHVPTAVFSQPPVGTVGLTEEQARATISGHIDVYRADFRPMKYVLPGRQERVMMKLIVERETDRVLGAHMVGADAPEIIQGVAIAIKAGAKKRDFDATVGIHPTSAEEWTTMFEPLGD